MPHMAFLSKSNFFSVMQMATGDGLLQSVDGVVPIRENLNPATWMLEISTPGAEQAIGMDFADHFADSDLARWELLPSWPLCSPHARAWQPAAGDSLQDLQVHMLDVGVLAAAQRQICHVLFL